jgi:hypothetical protein
MQVLNRFCRAHVAVSAGRPPGLEYTRQQSLVPEKGGCRCFETVAEL